MAVARVVNSFFNSCTYVLEGGGEVAWLVDCGDVEPLLPLIEGRRVRGVLLTHAHFDHIYGLNELLEVYPEAVIYTNEYGREALLDDRKNMSRYHETPFVFKHPENIRIANDGDVIELGGGVTARVVATPGHNPSCQTYVTKDSIFTGDSYIPGVKVVTNLPQGNKVAAQESIDKIMELAQGKTIYPGHATG